MIETSAEIKDLFAALLTFQAGTVGVHKDGKNPAFKSRYATLENVVDTVRPGLQAAGVVFTQAPGPIADGKLSMTTMLVHAETGQWMRSTMQIPLGKNDPQGAGSACTYSARYSLMAALGVPPTDDDDGERAMPDRAPPARPGNSVAIHTNGKPIDLSSSEKACEAASAALWKVSGGVDVGRLATSPEFIAHWGMMDPPERARIKALIAERKGVQ